MRINGHATLACKTKITAALQDDNAVTVEPQGVMPVIKDLVVDMSLFWEKVRQVEPWLQPAGEEPKEEYRAPNEAMVHLAGVMNCIMCGACVSDCTVLEVDRSFIAPAALAKAYRFVADPRDAKTRERLEALNQYTGIWDCTRCYECVQVCPKNVAPMERIMAMREKAIELGMKNTTGARHADAFAQILEHSGRLDELRLPIKTFGTLSMPLSMMPVALRALVRGKMPPVIHSPIPNAEKVRRIFEKVKEEQKQQHKDEE
jgi:succinate dehydrogenase / fumarate reductase iron-sulfur subunit